MSVNRERPYVFVLPEDDANHRLANGFLLDQSVNLRAIQVLPNAGGWTGVRDKFERDHIAGMTRYPLRHMVLIVDFDRREDRSDELSEVIPDSLSERVFILGVLSEPEDLRKAG